MQFNSWIFIGIFLPVVLVSFYMIGKTRFRQYSVFIIILGSLIFYGYANIAYLFYFMICIFINYLLLKNLLEKHKKSIFVLGLTMNIGALAILKYTNFFITSLNSIFKSDYNLIKLFIPLGLSFFTFQFIALLYDAYKGKITSVDFKKYLLFTTYFPKITQGPITLYQDFEQNLKDDSYMNFNAENFAKGLYLFTMGFGKKILIADNLAVFVNSGFNDGYLSYNSTMTLILVLSYTLQIYFDFSGYSDIAKGISMLFNIELPQNFNSPYKAISVNSFWKRWHMSLTNFFTKYLYIPLGGNRKGEVRTYLNTLIIFTVSGLWHGPNYTFIVWGVMHGIACVLEKKYSDKLENINIVIRWLYTFAFINVAWIFFRSNSLHQALQIIKNILVCDFSGVDFWKISQIALPELGTLISLLNITILNERFNLIYLVLLVLIIIQSKNSDEKAARFKPDMAHVFFSIIVLTLCILHFGSKITFIYEMF